MLLIMHMLLIITFKHKTNALKYACISNCNFETDISFIFNLELENTCTHLS